nr:MAG TPA: hypothetical protein [Caudoviricetes sp.]
MYVFLPVADAIKNNKGITDQGCLPGERSSLC